MMTTTLVVGGSDFDGLTDMEKKKLMMEQGTRFQPSTGAGKAANRREYQNC